jgi:hypothetical protein
VEKMQIDPHILLCVLLTFDWLESNGGFAVVVVVL